MLGSIERQHQHQLEAPICHKLENQSGGMGTAPERPVEQPPRQCAARLQQFQPSIFDLKMNQFKREREEEKEGRMNESKR